VLYEGVAERQVGWVKGLMNALPPGPWKWITPFIGNIAVVALSRRARKRFIEGAAGLAHGNLGEFVTGVLKSVGAMHSTPESELTAEASIAKTKADALRAKAEKVENGHTTVPPSSTPTDPQPPA